MEEALIAQAAAVPPTEETERLFARYQRVKALALNPGTQAEGKVALRQCLLDAVKLIF